MLPFPATHPATLLNLVPVRDYTIDPTVAEDKLDSRIFDALWCRMDVIISAVVGLAKRAKILVRLGKYHQDGIMAFKNKQERTYSQSDAYLNHIR